MKHIAHLWRCLALQVPMMMSAATMEIENKFTDTYVRQHPYFHNVNEDKANTIITNSLKGNVLFCNSNSPHEFLIVYAAVFQGHQIRSMRLTCNEDLGTITRHGFGNCFTLTETLSALQRWLQGFAQFSPNPILNRTPHESWSEIGGNMKEVIKRDVERKMTLASERQLKMEILQKSFMDK